MRRHLLACLVLAACSDSTTLPNIDAPTNIPDAPYDTARCLIKGHYGDLGAMTGTTSQMLGPNALSVTLDAGPPRDTFSIRLVSGRGAFPGMLMNGTFTLAGADVDNFSSCGLCVSIVADIVSMQGPSKFYKATGGMVTLTATQPPAGSVSNITFEETDTAGQTIPGGCTASITGLSFAPP